MTQEQFDRAQNIISELKNIKSFLEASSYSRSYLELTKQRPDCNMGENYTSIYRTMLHSDLGNKIISLVKDHQVSLEKELEQL
ncbi:hypothetical protein [Sphingobacterium multivorum]|uniref:hypothetical protein n=1 Tax=Sphingobacterium multivorum TaxID=28454 RepID=UPI003DA3C445